MAYYFTGAPALNQYVSLGSAYSMPTTAGTIAMWFYPTSNYNGDGTERSLFDVRHAVSNNYFTINKFSSNSFVTGWYSSGVDYRITTVSASYTVTQNAWNFVAFSWTSASTKTITINSYQNAVASGSTTWSTNGRPVIIGNVNGANHPAEARIAEFAIWNVQIPDADVLRMYNNRLSPACFPSGRVVYLPLVRSLKAFTSSVSISASLSSNNPDVADHCPVKNPPRSKVVVTGSGGGAGSSIKSRRSRFRRAGSRGVG